MKHTHHILFLIILGFFIVEPSNVIANTFSLQNNSGDTISKAKTDKFDGWTEEQYKHYEDSIISKLYPPVVSRRSEEPPSTSVTHDNAIMYSNMSVQNPHVPNTINIDKSKEVGEISINSGTLPSGAKTYEIPISVSPGMKGFTPNISLVYNSQQGNSTLGMGWSVSGISMIVRGGKSIYYDGKAEGIKMDNNDSFMLNGVRLIKTDATSGYILYESEQGNIKAKGFISGTTMTYFEVFFPNGDKGVFGSTMNFQNMLFYPLFSLEDLYGNTIRYAYTYSDNHYTISRISYNGCYVDFQYAESREDPILTYGGGKRVYEPKLLKAITSKHGAKILCTYTLSYSVDKKKSFLTRVDLSANGKSFNPIFFYYGEGLTATSYTKSETQLLEWYESDAPNMIKVVKGKFDYDSDADGLIVLPNKNPYWKHYRHSTAFRHSQNRFDNLYSGDEKIFLYAGLKDNLASPMPNLLTESGFVDIMSYDNRGRSSVCVYDTNRRGIVKSKSTPTYKGEYEYSVTTQTNRLLKILLTKKTETDLLKNIKVATSYSYDTYGYPTEEGVTYSDGTTIMKNTLYSQRNTIGDGYYLGFPINKTSAITREGTTYTERIFIPAYSHRQPNVRILYKNGNAVKEETFSYDSYGNVINSSVKDFSSTSRQTTKYEYNLYGRPTKTTSPMGLVTRFGYDDFGRVKTMSDFRGGVTSYSYDGFGRETSVSYPDNTHKSITLSWETDGSNGIYRRTQETTGLPKSTIVFDALNRDVCTSKTLLNGKEQVVLKEYDNDGHLSGITNPYDKSVSPFWKSYAYDIYGRVTSCTESSTAVTKYEYNGNSITTTSKGITQTQAYDALGNLISVTDSAGTITYQIAPDGNPVSITAPGNIKTTFGYDKYRRRISLADPSMGVTTYEYDASGNLSKETDANGNAKQYEYDQYNRLLKSTCPEFTTSYNYNTVGDLVEVSTSNGTGSTISYDVFGRIKQWKQTIQDGKWLQKDYTYADGNVSSIEYTSQAGQIAKENYVYVDGCLKEVNLNGTTNVYSIATLSSHGTASSIVSGSITRKYQYTPAGLLNERSGTSHNKKYQDFSYTFNVHTLNMMARKDNLRNLTENFKYDNLNRLMSFGDNSTTYDSKGNITSQSDVGSFDYDIPQKPYAVSGVTLTSENMPVCNQEVEYTSFSRPKSISENGYIADFSYFADYERTKMAISHDNNNVITRYYMGDCYELEVTPTGNKERLYLGGDYYSAPAVLVKENGVDKVYNVLRDNLGSITHIIAPDDSLVQELSYDAWGRLRDPATLQVFDSGNEPELFLGRGYTGHEHLTQFGLINMNARLYDAALGRFLSPDPYVQMPDFSQNFNRYSYCMNNPLKYVDKDGKSFLLIAAIVAGAYFGGSAINGTFNPTKWNYGSWKTYAGMAVGGVAGYAGAALGTSVAAAATASGASSIGAGMAGGMIGGMTSGAINGAGMAAISGGSLDDVMEGMTFGTVIGGLGGAISGGIGSSIGDFSGVSGSSFKNAVYELGHSTLKGIATGIGGGIMMAAMEDRIDYLWQGVAWGAALSVGMAGLRIGLMGTTIVPPGIEGRFDADDNAMGIRITYPVYRRGGLLRNWVPGITIGRNMMVDTRFLNSDSKSMQSQYYEILAHERAHVYQQKILGRAGFYLRTMYEYLINPGYSNNKPYNNPNCLEYWAEQYMKLTP